METLEGLWVGEARGPDGRRGTWVVVATDGGWTAEHRGTAGEGRAGARWAGTGAVPVREVSLDDGVAPVRLERLGDVLVAHGASGTARYRRVRSDVKQVIVYRRDLQMRKGKIAAQVAHASMKVLLDRDEGPWDRLEIPMDPVMAAWARARFAKVVLSVEDEGALVEVHRLALEAGLPTSLVVDAGRTEFHGVPTRTTVAVGPGLVDAIDRITGPGGRVTTKLA